MPYTDVINTTGALHQAYPELIVHIGNSNGDPPVSDIFDDAHCGLVVQSAGGERLDYAELGFGLSSHLINRDQPADFSRMIDVKLPDGSTTKIHRGDYVTELVRIDKDGESLNAVSQLRPYHFGTAFDGYDVWNPITASDDQIDEDIIFNPTVDDETVFNRSTKIRGGLTGNLWAHPELADASVGEAYQGQSRREWILSEAVLALCELMNSAETFVDNPTNYSALSGSPALRHVVIPLGTRLGKALDMLLIPLGYNHFVDYVPAKPIIKLFKIGDGTEKEVKFQLPPANIDLEHSNTNQFEISNDIADSFNEFMVLGEREEVEVTLPLYPGWPAERDDFSESELAKDGSEYNKAESAYRLFIANEAGDLDPAVARFGVLPVVPDLTSVVTSWIPHRRNLGEPLTYMHGVDPYDAGTLDDPYDFDEERAQRMPIVFEWSNDSGETWSRAEDTWTIKLCPDQIGVLFDNVDEPTEIYSACQDETFRARITGTVFSDWRVTGLASKQPEAVNGRDFRKVVPRPKKFQHRWRQASGTYKSALIETGRDADEKDDTAAAQAFAEELRDQNHFAEVDCEFRLPGWHIEYEIGDLITKVAGRELNLNAAPSGSATNRYPQVVERRFEMSEKGGPSTVLIMDRGTP